MENIKKQIDMLIKYECDNFDDLKSIYSNLSLRINEGLTKMKETLVFTEDEIAEINDYAKKLLVERFEYERVRIREKIRKSFKF